MNEKGVALNKPQ